MSVWWGREATAGDPVALEDDRSPSLFAGDRKRVSADVRARVPAYAPRWTRRSDDAGEALVRLFGEQVEAVATRLRRWPEKALVEYLVTAGVVQLPATPATAMLVFAIAPSAGQSVLVPAGFQVAAQGADGTQVRFETDRDLVAAPATIGVLAAAEPTRVTTIDASSTFLPFGADADIGRALWIGLDGDLPIGPELALGFVVWAPPGAPPPVGLGGVVDLPVPPAPLLAWERLDGGQLVPVEVAVDETGGLGRSGSVVLRIPAAWTPGIVAGLDGPPRRWLKLRVASGRYTAPPQLTAIALNSVPATAAVSVFDEVLTQLDDRHYQLQQTPVLPGTLQLAVDEGDDLGAGILGSPDAPVIELAWREVDDLSAFGPDDRVFVLDGALGIVELGDGVHGAAVPVGFRNVIARRYRVGGGAAGVVDAGTITALVSAAPFVTAATNPRPTSGGDDVEPVADAIRRGPEEVRARGRAVTLADYELLARRTPEADVRRAHASHGHPSYPEAHLRGVVGVIVVPADRGEGPPTPDSELLTAVARYLSSSVAPAGVEVVAAAPEYHLVRVEASVILDPAADVGPTVTRVLAALDGFLHPLAGGADGTGWPFGGAVERAALLEQIVAVAGVRAVPALTIVVDGEAAPDCSDVAIPAGALVWPAPHQIVPVEETP